MRVLLVLLALTSPALGAELTTADGGTAREVDFRCDVVLDGLVARVTTRQELRGSSDEVEAVYRFELPRDAAIVGLTITPPGGKPQRAAAVEAEAAITPAAGRDTQAMVPDLGLVRWLGDDGATTSYELIVYPLAEEVSTIVELTWVAPMRFVDGRLALRIPARGGALGAITGTVKATPPSGVKKLADLRVGGALVAAKPGKDAWPFVVDDDVSFEVTPVLRKPVVSFATAAVGDDGGAVAVGLLRPRADATALQDFQRVVFVLDLSSSNASTAARDAMAAIVGGVLDDLPDTTVQAFTFDHDVRPALPGFRHVTDDTRAALIAAIHDAPGAPGSDLRRAVEQASVGIDRYSTLFVLVTDGILPTDADAASLEQALGVNLAAVSAILIAPDDEPMPDPRGTALAEFTALHGGRVIALHPSEAAARAPTLAAELAADDWTIGVDDAALSLELPENISPGGGGVAFGWYRGEPPDELSIEADAETLTARKVKLPRLGALALVTAAHDDEHAAISRGRTLGVVTELTSLVAVDGTDKVAAARLALGAEGGTFARVPPPGEGEVAAPWVALEAARDLGARYELDIAGRIRADVIGPQLLPAARACFDAERVRGGSPTGTIKLVIEIARGEVIAARAMSASVPEMARCLREGAFALAIPSYTLDDPDAIYQIRYPLEFVTKGDQHDVNAVPDDGSTIDPIDLGDAVDQPLGGLTQQP